MPLPTCFSLLNLAWFENITVQFNNVQTATELQDLVNSAYAEISLLESNIVSQEALLNPVLALLTAPTDLAEVLTWIPNFITSFLTPYLNPSITMPLQIAEIAAQVADLTAAINAVAALKFPGITITIPPITIGCTL